MFYKKTDIIFQSVEKNLTANRFVCIITVIMTNLKFVIILANLTTFPYSFQNIKEDHKKITGQN